MKVLIAGCGYVGSELARQIVDSGRGYDVVALRRRPRELPAGIVTLACDLTDPRSLESLPRDIDAVVYAVGADASTPQAYKNAYVAGLDNLCRALASRGSFPGRLIVVTSTAVYAQDDGSWVDESSLTEPTAFAGRTLLASEALARSQPTRAIVVRFGGIYGPGRTRFIDAVREGRVQLADVPEYTNRIHRDDCAGVLAHLLRHDAPADLYLGVDDEPADRRLVVGWMARRLGVAIDADACAHGVGGTTDTQASPPAPTRARGKRCSNRRLRSSGYVFRYPSFREGYEAVLAAGRSD
jgi:nucleoside-diphosphate-sugar epimerase